MVNRTSNFNSKEVSKVEGKFQSENLSRRTLVKLTALATPALFSSPLLATDDQSASSSQPPLVRPRLFYSTSSLKQIQSMLAADASASAALKKNRFATF